MALHHTDTAWSPKIGDTVWHNHPDGTEMGKVIAFVPDDHRRAGQPVIESQHDEAGPFGCKKGDTFACHSMFLLPFEHGGAQWQQANAEGRVR